MMEYGGWNGGPPGGGAGTDPVRAYLNDVGRHDLLTRLDEERLGRVIETGRIASKELEEGDGSLPPERQRQLRALITESEPAAASSSCPTCAW